jgi:hypothetical protein
VLSVPITRAFVFVSAAAAGDFVAQNRASEAAEHRSAPTMGDRIADQGAADAPDHRAGNLAVVAGR